MRQVFSVTSTRNRVKLPSQLIRDLLPFCYRHERFLPFPRPLLDHTLASCNDVALSTHLIHIPAEELQQFSDGSASSTFDHHWGSEVDEVDQSRVGSALQVF
jgi:hypothetical protein